MNLRKAIFWQKDKWFDKSIRRLHLKDIEDSFLDYELSKKKNKEKLVTLMQYAQRHVPFYKNKKFNDILEFPVITKSEIKENYDRFISGQFNRAKLSYVTTSGSTGTPFTSYRDASKIARHSVDNIFFNQLAGVEIGYRLYYFRIWNKLVQKNKFDIYKQNIVPLNAGNFSKNYVLEIIDLFIRDKQPKGILAYASTYEALMQTIEELNIKNINIPNLKGIISMSETLPLNVKLKMENLFNTPVISRYSNMENGFIAQQLPSEGNGYFINHGSFHIEILKFNSDEACDIGEEGRIVITDLFNLAMPFIRYDTGDIGCLIKQPIKGKETTILSEISGRKVDFIYNTSGQLISPHYITNSMWLFSEIKQFQFIQKNSNQYHLKLNCKKETVDFPMIIRTFKSFLGGDASITIEIVDEIPQLASGKRKKVVNEYHK